MSYVEIWLQACLHWKCAYFQTLSWSDTIFVVDWDILYGLCGSANKWSTGFVFSGKIWWQFVSCNKACSKYHTRSTTTPKYTLTQRLVRRASLIFPRLRFSSLARILALSSEKLRLGTSVCSLMAADEGCCPSVCSRKHRKKVLAVPPTCSFQHLL